ncbi:aminoacyl-tRNA hydrolase [Buchnera aphidicola (Chaitoregma tattakana)]|uniref:aminoacyl-tRNA hydrolase n=1 Tax=Buchnera aphidicola TaxID=9 RepID=UPI0031B8A0D1
MKNIKLIVGLSNPYKEYKKTRHNVGSWFIRILSRKVSVDLKIKNKFFGYIGLWKKCKNDIYLLIPNLYMNLNGISISIVSSFYKIKSDDILIIQDDLNTDIGKYNFINSHNSYGHNGIKNVKSKFEKNTLFKRICIGIGKPDKNVNLSSYVLSIPTETDKNLIIQSIEKSMHIIEKFL